MGADALIGFGSPQVVALWLAASLLTIGWLVHQQRQGTLVTLPAYVVLLRMFVPILLQYPFTFSPLNIVTATGPRAFENYVPVIDSTLLICVLGMASFVAGFAIHAQRTTFAPARHVLLGIRAWSASTLLWLTGAIVFALFILLALGGLMASGGMRAAAMTTPALRPAFNLMAAVLPKLIGLGALVAVEKHRLGLGVLVLLLLVLGILTGSRSVAFDGLAVYIATVLTYRSLKHGLKTSRVLALIPLASALLFVIVFLGDVRRGQYSIAITFANFGRLLFYGNNFSDLRDFAWVLSYWNGEYFWGRTQLAGILGFIPSVLFPLRRKWGWGTTSLEIIGLARYDEVIDHPGLRPTIFGESYFNFGVPGVILAGITFGYVVRRLHAMTIAAARDRTPFEAKLEIYAAYVTLGLAFQFLNTGGFFSLYATLLMLNAVRITKYLLRALGAGDPRQLGMEASET